jgi:hypothetical protein
MVGILEKTDVMPDTKYFGPANVIGFDEKKGLVRIKLNKGYNESDGEYIGESYAQVAIQLTQNLQFGDSVLVAGESLNGFYIIGKIESNIGLPITKEQLKLKCGARAEVSGSPDNEILKVFSDEGKLIFEYEPSSKKTIIDISDGDLEINARKGNIIFSSSKEIRLISSDKMSKSNSALILSSEKIDINSPGVDVHSQNSCIEIEKMEYTGKQFNGTIKQLKLVMNRLESVTETIIETAKNIYSRVEGLTQLYTGRKRTIVETTYHLKSNRTFMKSEEDFKIKGDKIHLG